MSDLFLKNNIRNNSSNFTESSINLTNILGVNNTVRPTNNLPKINNTITESSMNLPNILGMSNSNNYVGGNHSITSSANLSKINSNDVNHLLSMLTSESNANTDTNTLENRLKNMLPQNGGAGTEDSENTAQLENRLTQMLNQNGGGDDENTEMLESKINNILNNNQSGGAMKSLLTLGALGAAGTVLHSMLNKPSMTETSEFSASNVIGQASRPMNQRPMNLRPMNRQMSRGYSATSSEMLPNVNNLSDTSINSVFTRSTVPPINNVPKQNNFIPITTTTIDNNSDLSATSSAMPNTNVQSATSSAMGNNSDARLNELLGGNNPALIAFREISAMVAKKLGISNGPNAKKIAGQLQRDTKEKNEGITHEKLVEAAKKQLESNLSKYEKLV
jgi:hypothetical protein